MNNDKLAESKQKFINFCSKAMKAGEQMASTLSTKFQIKSASMKLDKQYASIGRQYFNEISASPPEAYKPMCDAVNQSNADINKLNQTLASIKTK